MELWVGGESGFPIGCAGGEGEKRPLVQEECFLGNVFLRQL